MKLNYFKTIEGSCLLFIFLLMPLFGQNSLDEGRKFLDEQQYKNAIQHFKKIVKQDEKNDSAYYYLGYAYLQNKDHNKAIDYLEKAIELNEKEARYHFQHGMALREKLMNSNFFKKAIVAPKMKAAFDKTVELNPKHIEGRKALIGFYLQAPAIAGGDLNKAKHHAKALVDLDKFHGHFLTGYAYNREEKFDSARIEYEDAEKYFENSPKDPAFFNAFGYVLIELKEYDLAIEKFKKQLEMVPNDANSHDSLGDGYRAAGKLDLALSEYKKALEIDPDFKPSKKNYKELKKQLGE